MKASVLKSKLKVYSYVVVALLAILGIRLAVVQLFYNEVYQTQAKDNRIRLVSIKAPRGEIYTADGSVLAANELVYTLSLSYLGVNNQERILERLVEILYPYYPDLTVTELQKKIEVQKYRLFEPVVIARDIPWNLVVELEENRRELPGVSITVEPLRNYPNGPLAGHVLGYIHSISPEELERAAEEKYSINSLIGKSGVEKQYEKELRGRDGARRVEVDVNARPVQEAATLEPRPGNNLYLTLDMNLQKVMEDSMERTLKQLQSRYPKARVGSTVLLDVKTGEVLAMCSYPTLNPDEWKGNFKSELSSYYFPQGPYNPMNPGALTNRAIQATYPPGSTFKPITGMAALEAEVMNPDKEMVNCGGAYWIAPKIRCTGVHGNVNYYRAMAVSCNTYFQEMGRRATKDGIIRIGKEFGLGSRTGIDLPDERRGVLPTPEWKKEINTIILDDRYKLARQRLEEKYDRLLAEATGEEKAKIEKERAAEKARLEAQREIDYGFDTNWQPYDTFNMSIGQGGNDLTVIQLANYVATIANGGYRMQPHVLKKIVSPDGKVLKTVRPKQVHEVDISAVTLAETRRAMLAVTQSGGTAYGLFNHFPAQVQVAAKTGTAQTGRAGDNPLKEVHGVFIAFAPYDDPQIAFAGIVEYGASGAGSAAYVARDVFEQYFGICDHAAEIEAAKNKQQESEKPAGKTNQSPGTADITR